MTDQEHGKATGLDLAEVRRRLGEARGPQYWRSLEELAGDPEFQELLERELPRHAAEWPEGVSRRSFLALSAASLALGGLTACTRQPAERIVSYVRQPEELVPGRPLYYASAAVSGGYGLGVLVETHMGRPTKVEGNPEHPASLGATDVAAQASILSLYDPDRSQVAKRLGRIGTWPQLVSELRGAIAELGDGTGLRILTRTVTSPTLAAQLADVQARLPGVRWHRWEPAGRHSARAAAQAAFGRPIETRYDLSQADVILALDADFLTAGPGWVRNARDFTRRRKVTGDGGAEAGMNRLYAVESSPTATAAQADHRLARPPGEVAAFAAALAAELGAAPAAGGARFSDPAAASWIAAVAEDLASHRGAGAVIPGDCAPPEVHVLAHAINETLGNVGGPVLHVEPVEAEPVDHLASIAELARDMQAGEVDVLLILGGNPVYDAPADLELAAAMEKVRLRIHLGSYEDETSAYCHWHVPLAHELESWGDVRSADGTATLVQPTIEPLYGGKTPYDLLALFGEVTDASAYELVREHWRTQGLGGGNGGFETAWRRALHDGMIPDTESPAAAVTVAPGAAAEAARTAAAGAGAVTAGTVELALRPDPAVDDGTWANNGWLQELPKPLTKLTWDNAVLLAPATAEELGVATEDTVELEVEGRTVTAPVFVLPGHAPGAATVHLGYGRSRGGRVVAGAGFDAYRLRTTGAPWVARAQVRPAGGTYPLATTQTHHNLPLQTAEAHARHLVRHGTLEGYRAEPEFAQHLGHPAPGPEESLFPPHPYEGYAWGLSIDLTSCLGCNACVVACQSENNIPVVGKDQVRRGREMHWIRVDRYFEGDLEAPAVHHQPVMCMHCEQAPCEVVCPVAATVHSDEGLNDMVYNRCVGTRYCSNNCPYKVRRFNFLLYSDTETEILKMARNPDVTVRTRGVMEKCTYCVQRINGARIDAERQGREIRDGEITTACQQACPAEAITFGNVNDPESAVSRLKASPLTYGLLSDLGTRPRTTYLAKLTNPNPALAGGGGHGEGEH